MNKKDNLTVAGLTQFLLKLPPDMLVLTYNSLGDCAGGYAPLQNNELKMEFWDGVFDYGRIEEPQYVCKLGII